ncbi:MAG: bifunctional oligoribonuclease/PAP phosphatase NrnA [Lactobacillales bacterium]|jgi:phosphoesterase RecJ-like protein|nr:bifunctional oligoribonuclease/PAP phosphatase NrnA [Lactobacillales bacterium]
MTVQQQILEAIKAYDTIIIHRHMRPDPDALGSQNGLKRIIQASFPEKKVYAVGGPVEGLEFLATMDEISDEIYQGALVIVTDTANSPRISDNRYNLGDKLVKIDHHPNDEPYGDLVWVDTSASSASEIVMDFFLMFEEELKLSDEGARLLYAGIVGDTGRFLYPATTSKTLEIAARLLTYDFNASDLNREIDQISMNVAKLSGYVFQNVEVDENGAARVLLTQEIMNEFGVVDSETSHVVALPGQIDSVQSWGIFVQQPDGKYRVRLRSKGPIINEIAKRHDGGGHPLASGANATDLAECEAIYQEIKEAVKNFSNAGE